MPLSGRYLAILAVLLCALLKAGAEPAQVQSLKITILDTPVAYTGIGEWGFSALVEADGHRILYDTGQREDVALHNAEALRIDLSTIPDVVLSHNHPDHVGGLLTLRRSVAAKSPGALARAHVGLGIFTPRTTFSKGIDVNAMTLIKGEYEKAGGTFIVHDRPVELYPGVWLTGPVPRKYEPCGGQMPGTVLEKGYDVIPEDMALVCNTDRGLVVLTGCGHAGAINIITYAQSFIRPVSVYALIGGLHLSGAPDATMAWTSGQLRSLGVENILGAHCTGFANILRFQSDLALDGAHAAEAVVGSSFELGKGIDPGWVAK
jgi:7,8-dihydropterin-6-yl-methyl-4-(beta-D-ribofuranosyl)aminobenzene 5'-phosphate synthase